MIDPLTPFSSGIKKGIKAWLCVCRALISRGQIKFWSPKSPFSDSSLGPGGQKGQVRRSAGRTAMPPTQSLIHGNPAPKLIPRPDYRVDHGSSWIIMDHHGSSWIIYHPATGVFTENPWFQPGSAGGLMIFPLPWRGF